MNDKIIESVEEKRRKAIFEYVCFVADSSPQDRADVEKFDRKRQELHNAICEAYKDEPCFSRYSLDKLKHEELYNFVHLDEMLSDKVVFQTLDDIVEYVYSKNEDTINGHLYSRKRIKTEYAAKTWIGSAIAKFKAAVQIKIDQCNHVIDSYHKAWNESGELGRDKSFDHERNRYVGRIFDAFKVMDEFAELPREAYLKDTVKK